MKRTSVLLMILLLAVAVSLGVMRSTASPIGLGISPEIVSFTATPEVVSPGQSVTLEWKTRATAGVVIEWGPEDRPRYTMQKRVDLPTSGTWTVQPQENTVYVLECDTLFGTMCMSASVVVRTR